VVNTAEDDQGSYSVYFLWPDRYLARESPNFFHWPTKEQGIILSNQLGQQKELEFLKMTWKNPKTAICNIVSKTKMPYYSINWEHDTVQPKAEVERIVLTKPDIFQIPILYSGILLAIVAVNAEDLTADQRREVYELAMLSTKDLLQCIEKDIDRDNKIEIAWEQPIGSFLHDFKWDLCKWVRSNIDILLSQNQNKNGLLQLRYEDVEKISLVVKYLLGLIEIYTDIARQPLKWVSNLKRKIYEEGCSIDTGELIQDAIRVVESTGDLRKPPCNVKALDTYVFGLRVPLLCLLVNLIQNSKERTEKRNAAKPMLIIEEIDGENVRIEIKDYGVGMSPYIVNLFHDRRLNPTQGLAIAQNIAMAHSGKLELVSTQKDLGTQFSITIPRERNKR
jgi:K+-sensing histidine kinase KdpD